MKVLSVRNILFAILSIAIGVVFLFSSWSKLPTVEQFGWTVVETTFLNWTMAEWVTRILIGTEFFVGILFISFFRIKRIAIPLAVMMLVAFSIYLILVIIQHGNKGNCGCFGEILPLTPAESILKNAILLFAVLVLYWIKREWKWKYDHWILIGIFLATITFPFFYNPPESIYLSDKPKILNQPIPLSILYHSKVNKPPKDELRKGKHIIAFMSLTCEHCRKAAKRMRIMKQKNKELPFHFVLNGDSVMLKEFFEETLAENIPHSHFNGVQEFISMAGNNGLPSIKWVEDTTVYRTSNYLNLKEEEIIVWMRTP